MSPKASKLLIISIYLMCIVQDGASAPAPSINTPATDTAKDESQVVKEPVVVAAAAVEKAGAVGLKAAGPKSNSAEKLKRGLTNFMNQLNPSAFFVPSGAAAADSPLPAGAKQVAQSSAEPAAIVNGDPIVDVLIKGPNRLSQTRPIGGPLRWG